MSKIAVAQTPKQQARSFLNDAETHMEFWNSVLRDEIWQSQGKTKEQVIALANYFEGRYDMACNFLHLVGDE